MNDRRLTLFTSIFLIPCLVVILNSCKQKEDLMLLPLISNTTNTVTSGRTTGSLPKKTGQTRCYETNDGWTTAQAASDCNTPTGGYTLPEGQDGQLQIGTTPMYTGPTAHATYTGDYTTKDNITGLIWKTCTEGYSGADCGTAAADLDSVCPASTGDLLCNWTEAFAACDALNLANSGAGYAGLKNWRLPAIDELETIIDRSKLSGATLDLNYFPASVANSYWSLSTYVPGTTAAWNVSFFNGNVTFTGKTNLLYVRCLSTF